MSGYKITTKLNTQDEDLANNLMQGLGGGALINMVSDLVHETEANNLPADDLFESSPFSVVRISDFNQKDPVVAQFVIQGGIKFIKSLLLKNDAPFRLSELHRDLVIIRTSSMRQILRTAYNSMQNCIDSSNEAVKLERTASNSNDKSRGSWQVEAIEYLDKFSSYGTNRETAAKISLAREYMLSGEKLFFKKASSIVKQLFEVITPKENKRVAYTTLFTQNNEPYLMCPKGVIELGAAVPMEISKCRENCIDSRVSRNGEVTCAYQDWLKVSFQNNAEVFARLDVSRHPDNEENSLELKDGERAKPLTKNEVGLEARMDANKRGGHHYKKSEDLEDPRNREMQLSESKKNFPGHRNGDPFVKAPRQAQMKTLDEQLPRTDQSTDETLEEQTRNISVKPKYNFVNFMKTREENLDEKGMNSHKGEAEEFYPHLLVDNDTNEESFTKQINDKAGDGSSESVSNLLNKTAKKAKKDLTTDQLLDEHRNDKDSFNETREENLSDRRKNKDKDIDSSIQSLLDDEDEDSFGHKYSDEDLKDFADELGLDYILSEHSEDGLDF
jgi:hypothetical protein